MLHLNIRKGDWFDTHPVALIVFRLISQHD